MYLFIEFKRLVAREESCFFVAMSPEMFWSTHKLALSLFLKRHLLFDVGWRVMPLAHLRPSRAAAHQSHSSIPSLNAFVPHPRNQMRVNREDGARNTPIWSHRLPCPRRSQSSSSHTVADSTQGRARSRPPHLSSTTTSAPSSWTSSQVKVVVHSWVDVLLPYLVVTLELQIHTQDAYVSPRGLGERSCNQGPRGINPLDHILRPLLALPCPKRKHQTNVIMPLGRKLLVRHASCLQSFAAAFLKQCIYYPLLTGRASFSIDGNINVSVVISPSKDSYGYSLSESSRSSVEEKDLPLYLSSDCCVQMD
ncbi:uncharacterized protein BT62DRAFT_1075035 [Guyanagaster necrorhizus]|uniref:Uncharacterized protein n=1 Tax=Guyanagaster necrorhizus TaxID=856835 RepID=A0A9P8ATQ7_9AGAR|nr:uncharacterized protein BT62DRAFT_1075035 [Guyanagaster necrorhizus MCA 3950]KAG7447664.1 hypothetical protein BT62DRAFT_1075035 [Guyanagaster necrorhizus MCA 3950]